MDSKFNFTAEGVRKAACPAGKTRIRYMDTKVAGLGLRIMASGSKMFIFYRFLPKDNENPFKVCEIRIGRADALSIEQARAQAKALNNRVEFEKKDPSRKRAGELTYNLLFDSYIKEYAQLRTKTWKAAAYNHKVYFKRWQDVAVNAIKRADVQAWVNELALNHGKHTANRHFNTFRAVLSWGLKNENWYGDNPCIGVDRFAVQPRERFIQPGNEYAKFAEALDQEPNATIRDFFWTCLFTGARMSNVLEMEWEDLDFDLLAWRIPVTKNGDSQTIPLTPLAMEIFNRRKNASNAHARWVFPSDRAGRKTGVRGHLVSPRKAWLRVLERSGIENLRIHDLRRTAGSYMAIQGVSPAIIGKALGHRSPQATAVYARLTQDPVRKALENMQAALGSPAGLLPKKSRKSQSTGTAESMAKRDGDQLLISFQ